MDLEKARAAALAAKLGSIRGEIESSRQSRNSGAPHTAPENSGQGLVLWGAWVEREARRVLELQRAAQETDRALATQLRKLQEANRNVKVLEDLKEAQHARWRADFNRELESAASESHLARLYAKKRG